MTERTESFHVDLDATPDQVWRMLTTADGLSSWFGTRARIDLRLDGEVVVGWGDDQEIASRIRVLEPPRRLRLAYVHEGTDVGSEEWLVTVSGTTTRLTLVHTMPDAGIEDWDGWYGDVRRGWRLFLASLDHALSGARRPRRRVACRVVALPGARSDQWARVERVVGVARRGHRLEGGVLDGLVGRVVEPPDGALFVAPDRTLVVDLEGHDADQVLYVQAAVHDGDPAWIDRALAVLARVPAADA